MGEDLDAATLRSRAAQDLRRQGLALVDLSQALSVVRVEGSAAADLLAKGCGLDLHPRSFPAGRCARTRFASIPVLFDHVGAAAQSAFDLYVARSLSAYLHSWLADAAVELSN